MSKNDILYNIKYVSQITGLSTQLIRAWENRYSVVTPLRNETNRRRYTEDDIEKLVLVKKATNKGMSPKQAASLNIDDLRYLVEDDNISKSNLDSHNSETDNISIAIKHIINFDEWEFLTLLTKESVRLPKLIYFENFIFPLLKEIGRLWEEGELRIAHEHFSSSILVKHLNQLRDDAYLPSNSKSIIVCTPAGHHHELVALSLAVLISTRGFKVIYLGNNLPDEEIINALNDTEAVAAVLSMLYPNNKNEILDKIRKLTISLKQKILFFGGVNFDESYIKQESNSIYLFNNIRNFLKKIDDLNDI